MSAQILDGRETARQIKKELAERVAALGERGVVPGLGTVLVGDDPASHIYIDLKQKAATQAGMDARDLKLPADTSEDELLAAIADLNAKGGVNGQKLELVIGDDGRARRTEPAGGACGYRSR